LSTRSNATSKNVSWPHFSWPPCILTTDQRPTDLSYRKFRMAISLRNGLSDPLHVWF